MKLNHKVKHLSLKENILFVVASIASTWVWMLLCIGMDVGNDRGLLTLFGYIFLVSLIFTFLVNGNWFDMCKIILKLSIVGILIFVTSFSMGTQLSHFFGIDWLEYFIPVFILGISIFFILRQYFSFSNNKIAFMLILLVPIFTIIILSLFPFYDNSFFYDYGIGFLLGIYLTILFLVIGFLIKDSSTITN